MTRVHVIHDGYFTATTAVQHQPPFSTYDGSEEDDCAIFKPLLTKFLNDGVCHDVFKFYASFDDLTSPLYLMQLELQFTLHILNTTAFLCVHYVSVIMLTAV